MICVIWSHAADDCSSHVTWTRMNWFKPESLKLALVIWPNVPMINMLILCCFSACCVENLCIFFFFKRQFTCHGITKTLESFVMFIIRDQWHWSILKHHWLFIFFSCALTLYSYHFVDLKNVYFCWNNVTPALVIITVLSSCSCINIRLIFVCNTL